MAKNKALNFMAKVKGKKFGLRPIKGLASLHIA